MSKRKSIQQIDAEPIYLGADVMNDPESDTLALYGNESGEWNNGDTITVVLNCDEGEVDWYKNGKRVEKQDYIEEDKPYWFAMILCAMNHNQCRVAVTPDSVIAMYE